jgi:EmrB/QacA subfamily drug resistance transporter
MATTEKLDCATLSVASVVLLGATMSILDTTAVNVAVNDIALDLHSNLSTIQWVVTGYTLALATVIPLSGWAVDRFGGKRVYLTSTVLFMLGSILCSLAWSSGALIVVRIVQGLGGGLLMPVGMTIMMRAAGPQHLGRIMSALGVPMMVGPIVGPVLGGWLVEALSWHWIFYINIPIGLFSLILTMRVLTPDEVRPSERLDAVGLVLLSPGLALIIYGLAGSTSEGGFTSTRVLLPVLGGLAAVTLFVWHSLHSDHPLFDVRLFANRTFASGTATLSLVMLSVFGGMLLLPLYLQGVRGESPMRTGLLLAPQAVGAMITMRSTGRLSDRIGAGRIVPFGLVTVLVAFLLLTQVTSETSYWVFGAALFVLGLGMGATLMPTFSAAMRSLRMEQFARASTGLNIVQQVSASIGTAVLSVILVHQIADRLHTSGGGGLAGAAPGGPLPEGQRRRLLALIGDAYAGTYWWAVAAVVLALAVAVLLLPREAPAEATRAGGPDASLPLSVG